MTCLLSAVELPRMHVDLATHRRLVAFAERLAADDPTFKVGEDFEHGVYAAICEGLRQVEAEAGVRYDESTGHRLPLPAPSRSWWRRLWP